MKCRNFFVAHYSYYLEVTLSKKMYLEFYSTTKKCFNVQEFLQTYSCIKFAVHLFIIKVKPMWFLYSMFIYRNCDFSLFFGWFFFFTYCILWWNSEISVIKKYEIFLVVIIIICVPYSKGILAWSVVWYVPSTLGPTCIFFFVLVKIHY